MQDDTKENARCNSNINNSEKSPLREQCMHYFDSFSIFTGQKYLLYRCVKLWQAVIFVNSHILTLDLYAHEIFSKVYYSVITRGKNFCLDNGL